jgi:hypothetical protein
MFGLIMSLGSMLLVVFKWFTMKNSDENETGDANIPGTNAPVTPATTNTASTSILAKLEEASGFIKQINTKE